MTSEISVDLTEEGGEVPVLAALMKKELRPRFEGFEAVSWLLQQVKMAEGLDPNEVQPSEEEVKGYDPDFVTEEQLVNIAVELGNLMMEQGFITNVIGISAFRNDSTIYEFVKPSKKPPGSNPGETFVPGSGNVASTIKYGEATHGMMGISAAFATIRHNHQLFHSFEEFCFSHSEHTRAQFLFWKDVESYHSSQVTPMGPEDIWTTQKAAGVIYDKYMLKSSNHKVHTPSPIRHTIEDLLRSEHPGFEELLYIFDTAQKDIEQGWEQQGITTIFLQQQGLVVQSATLDGVAGGGKGSATIDEEDGESKVGGDLVDESSSEEEDVEENLSTRHRIAKEIVETEASYVKGLQTCMFVYFEPLRKMIHPSPITDPRATKTWKKGMLAKEDLLTMVSNIDSIIVVHEELLSSLQARWSSWKDDDPNSQRIGDLFERFSKYFTLYTIYVNNLSSSLAVLERLSDDKSFQTFHDEAMELHAERLRLMSYLIMPIQRMPRYQLLLQQLARYTEDSHPDHKNIIQALGLIKDTAVFINEYKRMKEWRDEIMDITSKFDKRVKLYAPGRQVLKTGMLRKVDRYVSFVFLYFIYIYIYISLSIYIF